MRKQTTLKSNTQDGVVQPLTNKLRTIRLNNEKDIILITTQDNGKPFPAEHSKLEGKD